MKVTEHGFGQSFEVDDLILFYGRRGATRDVLEKTFPDLTFVQNHQVHGDRILNAADLHSDSREKADGLYTDQADRALIVVTADCLPIFMRAESTIVALHAGWRGVAQRIFPRALEVLPANEVKVWIGPHIQRKSFEIDEPVLQELIASAKKPGTVFERREGGKSNLDLSGLVKAQGSEFVDLKIDYQISSDDTVTNLRYESYRRDRENSQRQMHFIARRTLP